MSDSLTDSLNAGDAPGWKPEEGDLFVGTVSALSTGWSDYKEGYYPIVTITPDMNLCNPAPPHSEAEPGSPVAVHGFQFVLEDRFSALKPTVGERIGIKVGPKIPTKDGKRTVQTYTVKMDREQDIWSEVKGPRAPKGQQAAKQQELPVQEVTDDDIPF